MFPQGLTDHIVTVTTQPADGETESLEMTHDILGAEGESEHQSFNQVIRGIIYHLSQVSAAHFVYKLSFVQSLCVRVPLFVCVCICALCVCVCVCMCVL